MRNKRPTRYNLIPGLFMIFTCLAALVWETWIFVRAVLDVGYFARAGSLIGDLAAAGNVLPAVIVTWIFIAISIILFLLGTLVFIDAWTAFRRGPEAAEVPEVGVE